MKTRVALLIAMCIAATSIAVARTDKFKVIPLNEFPKPAQEFVESAFGEKRVALATQGRDGLLKSYDIKFEDGTHINFNSKGEWEEIEMKGEAVPVSCVPVKVAEFVESKYPKSHIVAIERSRKEIEVELSSGLELVFDKEFKLIGLE